MNVMNNFERTNKSEHRWTQFHHIDMKRLREVHLLVDELRNRLRQLNIHFPRDFDVHFNQRRKTTLFEQQNWFHLKVFLILQYLWMNWRLFLLENFLLINYYIQEPIDAETVDRELSSKDPLRTMMITRTIEEKWTKRVFSFFEIRNLPLNEGILYRNQIEEQIQINSKSRSSKNPLWT